MKVLNVKALVAPLALCVFLHVFEREKEKPREREMEGSYNPFTGTDRRTERQADRQQKKS